MLPADWQLVQLCLVSGSGANSGRANSGVLLAGVLIIRGLPGFFLFPICGVVADR